jgi:hypothetical protein
LNTRKAALIESVIELLVFSALSIFVTLSLFHAAILAAPLLAFMWTFFGFSLLASLLGRRTRTRYVISFAVLNLLFSACLLFVLVKETILKISGAAKALSMILLVVVILLYPALAVAAIRSFLRNRAKDDALGL